MDGAPCCLVDMTRVAQMTVRFEDCVSISQYLSVHFSRALVRCTAAHVNITPSLGQWLGGAAASLPTR